MNQSFRINEKKINGQSLLNTKNHRIDLIRLCLNLIQRGWGFPRWQWFRQFGGRVLGEVCVVWDPIVGWCREVSPWWFWFLAHLKRWRCYFGLKHMLMVWWSEGWCCHLWRSWFHQRPIVEHPSSWRCSWRLYRCLPYINKKYTVGFETTLTFLLWVPFPPVLASPILFLNLSMLAWISSGVRSICITNLINFNYKQKYNIYLFFFNHYLFFNYLRFVLFKL